MPIITARVVERITESKTIEVEAPPGLDLEDGDAVQKFLEEAFISCQYHDVEGSSDVTVHEREIAVLEGHQHR